MRTTGTIARPRSAAENRGGAVSREARALSAAAAVALLALAGPVASEEEALVPGTDAWTLSHDPGDAFCLVQAFYPESKIGLGFVSDGVNLGFGLVKGDWNLPERATYKVRMRFDGERWGRHRTHRDQRDPDRLRPVPIGGDGVPAVQPR